VFEIWGWAASPFHQSSKTGGSSQTKQSHQGQWAQALLSTRHKGRNIWLQMTMRIARKLLCHAPDIQHFQESQEFLGCLRVV